MKKRKDECLFCTSRSCFDRVVSSEDDGNAYDEIACMDHIQDLYKHSDKTVPGVMKIFASSTGQVKRGDMSIFKSYKEVENELLS